MQANGNEPMTLQQLFGIELPIIQAPMAGSQGSALALAVSNAGGLGSLPCAALSLEAMRHELAAITAQTDRPINVNFFLAAILLRKISHFSTSLFLVACMEYRFQSHLKN